MTNRQERDRGFGLLPPPRAARGDSRGATALRRPATPAAPFAPGSPGPRDGAGPPTTAAPRDGAALRDGAAPPNTAGTGADGTHPQTRRPGPDAPAGPGPLDDDLPPSCDSARALLDAQLHELAALPARSPGHAVLRHQIVESQLPLVHHLAQRFRGRGEPYDDLVQVGTIGLLKAVDRFDPGRGSFTAFAVPTILGEIRRHFRDRGWAMRVPRRLQDFGRRVSVTREQLTQQLGHSPTVKELAAALDGDPDLVVEAIETATAFATVPLPTASQEELFDSLGGPDHSLEQVEQRVTLGPLLARLPARERTILALRFGRGLSQSQIALEVGISQMHVSRLLARSLATLREHLTEEV